MDENKEINYKNMLVYVVCAGLIYTLLGLPGIGRVLYTFQYIFEGSHHVSTLPLEPFGAREISLSNMTIDLQAESSSRAGL